MKRLGALLLSLDGMLVHARVPSMKQLGVLLLPPGWDTSPLQAGLPRSSLLGLPGGSLVLGLRETKWSKISWLRKQYDA